MMSKILRRLGIGISVIAILGGAAKSVYYVPEGHRAVMFDLFQQEFHGIRQEIIGEGIHFRIPWFQRPVIFDIRPKKISASLSTKSKASHRPWEDLLPKIFSFFGYAYAEHVPYMIKISAEEFVILYETNQISSETTLFSQELANHLTDRANQFGIILEDISIRNLTIGEEFTSAVEGKQLTKDEKI